MDRMLRSAVIVASSLVALLMPHAADAQNAVRGRALYNTTAATKGNAGLQNCVACHSAAGKTGKSAAVINNAINGNVGGMGQYAGILTLSPDMVDIAAYLANPAAVPNPVPAVNPGVLNFGNQAVGTQGTAMMLTLQHDMASDAPFQLAAVSAIALGGTNAGEFRITGGTCANSSTLALGANCTVLLAFAPAGAAGGRGASVTFAFATAGVTPVTVIMSGNATVTPTPTLSLSANTLAFGNQQQGASSAAQSVTLTNSGTAALSLNALTLAGAQAGDFARSGTCAAGASLAAGATCTITATFTPTAIGARAASVVISSNNPGGDVSIALTGTGTSNVAVATITPSTLSFLAQVGVTTAAQNVTVTNTGGGALTVSAVASGNATVFPVTNGCTTPLSANGSCTIGVRFAPAALGAVNAALSITHSAAMTPATVALTGTGNAVGTPVPSINPSTLAFPTLTAVGQQSTAQRVTLSNAGPGALTLTTLSSSAEFVLVAPAAGACAGGATIAQGASCFIDLRFAPAAAGARTGTLTVNSNGAPAALTVALTGTASAVAAPIIGYAPSGGPVFGPTAVGVAATPIVVTVTNVGSAPLAFGAAPAAVTGTPNAGDFAITSTTCGGQTLAPNQGSCAVTVAFTPVAGTAATRSAVLTLTGTATAAQIPLYGVVTNPGPAAAPPSGGTPPATGGGATSGGNTSAPQNDGGGGALDGVVLGALGIALMLTRRRRHESWLH